MEDYYQYRLLQDGRQIGEIENTSRLSDEWSTILDRFEGRYDGVLTLQRQLIAEYDQLYWELIIMTYGANHKHLHIKDMIIYPWQTVAEFDSKPTYRYIIDLYPERKEV